MRNILILLVFVITTGCAKLAEKQFTPPVTIYNWKACLLDTQNPQEVFCKPVQGTLAGNVVKLKSRATWVVVSMDDFRELITFFRQYCSENLSACKDFSRGAKKWKNKKRGK